MRRRDIRGTALLPDVRPGYRRFAGRTSSNPEHATPRPGTIPRVARTDATGTGSNRASPASRYFSGLSRATICILSARPGIPAASLSAAGQIRIQVGMGICFHRYRDLRHDRVRNPAIRRAHKAPRTAIYTRSSASGCGTAGRGAAGRERCSGYARPDDHHKIFPGEPGDLTLDPKYEWQNPHRILEGSRDRGEGNKEQWQRFDAQARADSPADVW